jgi:calcium-dependent protein kinase
MLDRDPQARATASHCLRHAWMRDNGCGAEGPPTAELFRRVQRFSGMNVLKRLARLVIASHLPLDQIAGLRELFLEVDRDGSGRICVDEFVAALGRKGQVIGRPAAQQILRMADINGDGELDYEEWLSAMINISKSLVVAVR